MVKKEDKTDKGNDNKENIKFNLLNEASRVNPYIRGGLIRYCMKKNVKTLNEFNKCKTEYCEVKI